jgi:hypothetical protein
MRGAARALLWTVWCALAAAVPAGTALLLMWLVLEMWRAGYHWLVLFLFLEGGLLVSVGVLILTFRYARRHWTERPGRWKSVVCFVGVLAVLAGWFVALVLGPMDVDQQILHDRGVTATGLVTRAWHDEGDSGPTNFQFDVRLGDGTTIDVGGVRPVGSTVHVTYDPLGRADPQLGTRPAAPRGLGFKASLAVLIVGCLMTASTVVGPLDETPADETPDDQAAADAAPSGQAPADQAPSRGL